MPTGSRRRPASRAASSRRRSATTSSRPAGTTASSACQTSARTSLRAAPLSGSPPPDRLRSTAIRRSASTLLERAAALLPAEDAARLEILPELAEALFVAGKLAQGQAVCEEAIEAAERRGDRRIRAHALVVLVDWRLLTGQEGKSGSGTTRGRRRAGGLRGGRGRTRPRPSVESVRSIGLGARTA